MVNQQLTDATKHTALKNGADLVGVVNVNSIPENAIDACPVNALGGTGDINKKRCGDVIFKYDFRYFAGFMQDLIRKPKSEMKEILNSHGSRELWQNFMTGNYYYCFQCQSQCPTTKMPQTDLQ